MDTPQVALPFTAWEQAVFVSIFAVVFIALIALLLRWFTKQQESWQSFIDRENQKTREWLDQQECNNRKAIGQVTEALELVITQLRELTEQLTKHDDKVEDKFDEAVKTITNGNGNRIPDRRKTPRS